MTTQLPEPEPDAMPVFTIKAKDALAVRAVRAYLELCEEDHLDDQAAEVRKAMDEMCEWRHRHPDLIKTPDHPHVPASAAGTAPERQSMYERVYFEAGEALDQILGPGEEDGAGAGLVGEIWLVAQQRDEARAQRDAMRPIVEAAQAWRADLVAIGWTAEEANESTRALVAAVDASGVTGDTVRDVTPAAIPDDEPSLTVVSVTTAENAEWLRGFDAGVAKISERHRQIFADVRAGHAAELDALRKRLADTHDALTRITDADDDVFTTLESTVEYVVAGWRRLVEAEAEAADAFFAVRKQLADMTGYRDAIRDRAEALEVDNDRLAATVEQVRAILAEQCDGGHGDEDCWAPAEIHRLYRALDAADAPPVDAGTVAEAPRAGRFEQLLADPHEQFDQRRELLASVVEYMDAPGLAAAGTGTTEAGTAGSGGAGPAGGATENQCPSRVDTGGVVVRCQFYAGHTAFWADHGVRAPMEELSHDERSRAIMSRVWCSWLDGDEDVLVDAAPAPRTWALPDELRGDGPCGDCGTLDNIVWFTESVLWNAVMRPAGYTGDPFLCISCFVKRVDAAGYYPTGWRLIPDWHWETKAERQMRLARERRSVGEAPDVQP